MTSRTSVSSPERSSKRTRVADGPAELDAELLGDALGDGAGGEPPRLRVGDGAAHAAPELEADLRQLRRLARAGLAGDDDDLVGADRREQVVAARADRQLRRVFDRRWQRLTAASDADRRSGDVAGDTGQRSVIAAFRVTACAIQPPAQAVLVADRQVAEAIAQHGDLRRAHLLQGRGHRTDEDTAAIIERVPESSDRVRVDKWLWAARLLKTRSLAAEAVKGGRVQVNGQRVKASKEINPGDELELTIGQLHRTVVVQAIAHQRGPAKEAALLYDETEQSVAARELAAQQRRLASSPPGANLAGRPTKRDRRRFEATRGRRGGGG